MTRTQSGSLCLSFFVSFFPLFFVSFVGSLLSLALEVLGGADFGGLWGGSGLGSPRS